MDDKEVFDAMVEYDDESAEGTSGLLGRERDPSVPTLLMLSNRVWRGVAQGLWLRAAVRLISICRSSSRPGEP
jgi:hypothetical protein